MRKPIPVRAEGTSLPYRPVRTKHRQASDRWGRAALALLLLGSLPTCVGPSLADAEEARLALVAADGHRARGEVAEALLAYGALLEDELDDEEAQLPADVRAGAELGLGACQLALGREEVAARHAAAARAAIDAMPPSAAAIERQAQLLQLDGDLALVRGDGRTARQAYEKGLALLRPGPDADRLRHRVHLAARLAGEADASWRGSPGGLDAEQQRLEARVLASLPPPVETPKVARAAPPVPEPAPTILPRSRWNARPLLGNHDPMRTIRRITVHHSAIPFDAQDAGDSARAILSIQRTHQDERKWADIGYHYVVDRAGRIWEGRPIGAQGAHAGNPSLNDGNVGVVVLGDYQVQRLTPAQRAAIEELLRWLQKKHRVPMSGVLTHKEIREANEAGSTECPGSGITELVRAYRSGLAQTRSDGRTASR